MNCDNLIEIIDKGEDSKHQFKQNFNSIDQLAVEISAFTNSEGGLIIIGVSDSGELKGIEKEDVMRLNQWISNATTNKIDKQILVQTEILICNKKRIMILQVPRGLSKPYAVNRVDVWVKSGADKRRAPIEEVLRLAQTSGLHYADEIETEASLDDFDKDFFIKKYNELYKEKFDELNIPFIRLLTNLKLMNNNKLTLAGLLLFGKNSGILKPQYRIKATYFAGDDITEDLFKDKEEIDGKLIENYKKAISFIKRNLRRKQVHDNFNAPGVLEIPLEAFSEIIANAIIHRNYYISAPIQINLFENRLEIKSPGNLPNTLNEENIKFGVHIERNPIILSYLEKDPEFRYTGRGSGIPRVLKICKRANVKIEFIDDRSTQQFKVIFFR
jgi:ATP-dependent DNA helicase RecG